MVRELLGSVGPEALLETTAALYERRAADALRIVDRLSNGGRDLGQFVGELISHLRNLMLLPYAPEVALAEVGAEERGSLEQQANNTPTAEIVRLIQALDDTLVRIKRGGDPKLELELSFLKLTRDYTEPSVDNLLGRLEALEWAVEQGSAARVPETTPEETLVDETAPEAGASGAVPEEPEGVAQVEEPEDGTDESPQLSAQWGALMQDLRDQRQAPAAAVYEEARVERFDGALLELSFPDELSIYVKLARDARHADPLREAIARHFGVSPRIECRVADGASEVAPPVREESSQHTAPPGERREDAQDVGSESRREEPRAVDESSVEEARGRVSGEAGGDDLIRDQREVFEMARERFGLRDPNGGN
jgi:DNA polymerase-3 subunit gamma/tau